MLKNTKQIILGIILILFCLVPLQNYAQHSIFFNAGGIEAEKNIYLSDGFSFEVGHQYTFKNNLFLQTALNAGTLKQNPSYTFSSEPSISPEIVILLPHGSELKFANFNINTNAGYVFLKKYRIQPIILAGLSGNFTYHTYTKFTVWENGISADIVNGNQFHVGFQVAGGLFIRITQKISLQGLFNYSTFPFVKIGIQEKQLNLSKWQCGISYKIN